MLKVLRRRNATVASPPPAQQEPTDLPPWRRHDAQMKDLSVRQVLARLPHLMGTALRIAWSATRPLTALSLALGVLSAAATAFGLLAATHAMSQLLDGPPTVDQVLAAAPALIAIAAAGTVQALLGAASSVTSAHLRGMVEHEAVVRLLRLATDVDLEAFEDPQFYDALEQNSRAGTDAAASMVEEAVTLAGAVIGLVATAAVFTSLHPVLLPLLALSAVPLGWSAARAARARYRHAWRASTDTREAYMLRSMMTDRDEAAEVRAFGLGASLRDRYQRTALRVLAERQRMERTRSLESLAGQGLSALGMGLVYVAILVLLARGELAAAAAGGAVVAAQSARSRLGSCVRAVNGIYAESLYLRDYARFEETAVARSRQARVPAEPVAGVRQDLEELHAHGVTYTYPGQDRPAVRGVDVTVRRGEVIALVGENGSGKSTLAKVIAGLYAPQQGAVHVNGEPVTSPTELTSRVGVLFQDFAKWPFTVTGNITVGDVSREADLDDARAAAAAAGVDGIAAALPDGMDTLLTRAFGRGTDLSGGQWQRVGLARAFFRNAPLLILDEPTAALDARAEHAVFERVQELCTGRAVLLISHRLASVRNADRIYVLDKGAVVECGTHEQLMTNDGLYAELFTLQASAYTEQAPAG